MAEEQWVEYLASVGMTGPLATRALTVSAFYSELLGIKVSDIFISEYTTEDGSRQYESMWLFNEDYVMEAKAFVRDDNFDVVGIRNHVSRYEITKIDYDFVSASPKSRMTIHFSLTNLITGTLKASGENCDHLRDMILKYIAPNVIKSRS